MQVHKHYIILKITYSININGKMVRRQPSAQERRSAGRRSEGASTTEKEKCGGDVVRVRVQRERRRAGRRSEGASTTGEAYARIFHPHQKKKDGCWCRAPGLGARERIWVPSNFGVLIGILLDLDFYPFTLKIVPSL